jgi:hypothetical protein
MRKRLIVIAAASVSALALLVAPAGAHDQTVTPKGGNKVIENWVGAGDLPGQGQGLVPGGPGGIFTLSPAHVKGLNATCEQLEANPSVVDIRGPGGPGCAHGE